MGKYVLKPKKRKSFGLFVFVWKDSKVTFRSMQLLMRTTGLVFVIFLIITKTNSHLLVTFTDCERGNRGVVLCCASPPGNKTF